MTSPKKKILSAVMVILLVLLLLWIGKRKGAFRSGKQGATAVPVTPIQAPVPTPPPPVKSHVAMPPKPALPPPAPVVPPIIPPIKPPVMIAPPSEEGLHKELIPRNISIVRCYYDEEVVAPGTRFGFDINGSGFDEAFHQMIAVDFDALDIEAQDLQLVTANQIHGTVVVGTEATTQYIYPRILIRSLPVFKAKDPFGVVRRGEALDIVLLQIDESGQAGRFRLTTNLDQGLYKRFRMEPSSAKLEIEDVYPQLPFFVDGTMRISPGLKSGEYGLTAYIGNHVLLKRDPVVDVVKPTIGHTGTIDAVKAAQPVRRPGDVLDLIITGSGFTSGAAAGLTGKIEGLDNVTSSITYLTAGKLQMSVRLPSQAPVAFYGVTILQKGSPVHERKKAFAIVPPNWLGGVALPQPLSPGQRGVVHLSGRDLSPSFVSGLKIETDEPGLNLMPPRLQDPSTIAMDVQVSTSVAAGDYLIHVSAQGQPLRLPMGEIIKITR